jgi:hypothetical protein
MISNIYRHVIGYVSSCVDLAGSGYDSAAGSCKYRLYTKLLRNIFLLYSAITLITLTMSTQITSFRAAHKFA